MAAVAFVLPLAAAAPAHAYQSLTINPDSPVVVDEPSGASSTVTFTVSPNCGFLETSTDDVPVSLVSGTATAGQDFSATPSKAFVHVECRLTGVVADSFTVTVLGDTLDEDTEQFGVNVGTSQAIVKITDNDPAPSVSVADAQAAESGPMKFTVSLSAASSKPVTVPYTLAGGTATAGTDFDATAGSITIPAGQTSGTITVPVVQDAINESSETFTVALGSPTNGQPGAKTTATGTILDDDSISFSIVANPSVTEGNSGTTPVTFTVRKTGQTTQTATVHVKTRDGSAGAPTDYQALADTTLTFAPGDTEKTVTVLVNGDTTVEGDEVFGLDLFNPSLGSVTTATATATIRNDDTPPAPPVKPPVTTPVTNPGTTPVTPVTPVTGGSASASTPKVSFKPLSFSKKQRRLTVTVTCPVSEKTCRVQLTVFTVKSAKSKIKQLRSERKLGSRIVIVPGGRTASITITLSKTNAKLLKRAKKIPVRAYAVVTDNDGNVGTSSKAGTLRG